MEKDRISVLPDGVANQIAAGEVVGRPASVVKELMENAVDAGSTSVTVNYRDGGRSLLQVVDNGCGMSETDARLAFERHATSKIRSAADLYRLRSFGFRGEALPSIASVAEVELRTRMPESELGTQVTIHGGRFVSQSAVQTAVGTQFVVRNLFYNTPARRRFLKEASVEARHIRTEFLRVALCNPQVAFSLYDNDVLVTTLPASNLRQRIVSAIGGKEIARNLLDVSVDTSMVRVEGFVGRPASARKTNRDQYLFVNGRYFNSAYFRKAVLQAYDKLVAPDTQPSYFLYITIDPERIDVNVHPQKTEIKFDDEQAVWQIFNAAVRESLGKLGVVPLMDFEVDDSFDIPVLQKGTAYREPSLGVNPAFNPFEADKASSRSPRPYDSLRHVTRQDVRDWEQLYEVDSQAVSGRAPEDVGTGGGAGGFSAAAQPEADDSVLEFIEGADLTQARTLFEPEQGMPLRGAIPFGDRYVVTVTREGLAVVDVPRAYERVLYERYLRMLGNNSSATQQLLFAETVPLDAEERLRASEAASELRSAGFDFTLGDDAMTVTGCPAGLPAGELAQTLLELLGERTEQGGGRPDAKRMAAVMARRGAAARRVGTDVRAAEELLAELFDTPDYNYTPAGTPVLTFLTEAEVTKRLK